jgi:hypothetical protein
MQTKEDSQEAREHELVQQKQDLENQRSQEPPDPNPLIPTYRERRNNQRQLEIEEKEKELTDREAILSAKEQSANARADVSSQAHCCPDANEVRSSTPAAQSHR